jgi:hypothetical protein
MIRVSYDDMKFYYVESFYDYPLSGTCIHNGQVARFLVKDETDYQTMEDTCPCCKEDGTGKWEDCHCQNAPDLFYEITTLPLKDRIKYRMKPYYDLLWYIKSYGLQGMAYWNHWFRGRRK